MTRFLPSVIFSVLMLASVAALAAEPLREVRISGAQRIEPATVLTYLNMPTGMPLTEDAMNDGLKNLFATNLFSDVNMRQQRGVLFVEVVENPIINQIAFEGNERIKDEELMAEIGLRPRQVYTRTRVQNDVARVYQLYQRGGRFAVTVEPKIIELDQNRVNLVFEIIEGQETNIRGIRFVGNTAFTDEQLRSELSSKESRWYRFFSSSDRYDEDRVKFDEELLRRYYLRHGYADARVVSSVAELSEDRKSFYLTFTMEEGPRYAVSGIAITSNLRGFDANSLRDDIGFVPGQWYDADAVEASTDRMIDRLGDLQYAFADVDPRVTRNTADNTVNIEFVVEETPRVFVERIDIHGNVRSIDKVVRREFLMVEGDPFSRSKLARSEQRLRNLNYFEKINIRTLPGSAPDRTVIDVEVVEQSTGELSIGAGFSTQDGPLADLRIRERNLLGRGQDLSFATTVAGKRTQFDMAFTEPYFLDRDLAAGFDAFHVTRDFQDVSSYDQRRTGGALRLGYPLSEKVRQTLRYRFEQNEITDVSSRASRIIREQEGKRSTSALSQRLTYDSRDSVLFPAEGLYSWFDLEGAGLGGDARYVSGTIGSSYYIPIYEKKVVLNLMGEGGMIGGIGDENVRINERFFLGGDSLRGFERSGVGPRDRTTDDSLGGNYFYRGTAELSFPIGFPEEMGIAGHLFTDFGSLWGLDDRGAEIIDENSIRAAAGLGLSWRSPMGPVRVDLAFPYAKEDFDEKEPFRFSFGTRF